MMVRKIFEMGFFETEARAYILSTTMRDPVSKILINFNLFEEFD